MKPIFTLLLSMLLLVAAAQKNPEAFHFKTALTANPLLLVGVDNTIMMGAEHRLQPQLAVALEAGYVFDSYYFRDDIQRAVHGVALRPGVKWYNKSEKGFFEFQVAYKLVNYRLYDWLGKDAVAGVPSYEQLQEFTYRKRTVAFNALAGELFRISNTVLLELYAGLGAKLKHQRPVEAGTTYRNLPSDFSLRTFEENRTTLSVPIGLKLFVVIR